MKRLWQLVTFTGALALLMLALLNFAVYVGWIR